MTDGSFSGGPFSGDRFNNPYMDWTRQHVERAVACRSLPHLGRAARNNLEAERIMRDQRRGGVLDVHRGETGLAQQIGPGDVDRPLLQLSASNRTDPELVTLGLDVKIVEDIAAVVVADHRLQFVLTWGTGKGQSAGIVDARHGDQVTLSASIINASVRYVGTIGPTFRVSASAAYNSRPGGESVLTFTEVTVLLAAGALSVAFRIPSYATRVSWKSPDDPNAAVPAAATLQFRRDALLGGMIVSQSSPARDAFVAIPNGADFIRIDNDATVAASYFLLYEVHL